MLRSRPFSAALTFFFVLLPTGVGGFAKDDPAGREVFDPAPVLWIRIELPDEAMAALRSDPRAFVRGTVEEGGRTWRDVGVRLKGSIGSFQPTDGKPGFTLKFNQFVPKARFHGLKKLILDNSDQDPTYVVRHLGGKLFRATGVPASRTGYAAVELNARKLGLYVISEAASRDFLARWFEDASGPLYEGPGEIDSPKLDIDSGTTDRSDLRELADAARERDPVKRLARLEKLLDLDRFISFLAMEAIACHWDGYSQGRNNYRLYHDPKSGRMVFILHGADQLFQNPDASLFPTTNGIIARAILRSPDGRRRYRERVRKIPEKILSVRIAERARSVREQLDGKRLVSAGPALPFDSERRARLLGWQPRALGGGSPDFSRVSRDQLESKLSGDHGWTTSAFDFEIDPVEEAKEQPTTQVELVCELQASRGRSWFDEASLVLRHLPVQSMDALQ